MTDIVIPILREPSYPALTPQVPAQLLAPTGTVADTRGRQLRDVRISVTDQCNFRCTYCMPKEVFGPGYRFLPRSDLLSFEEIERTSRIFAEHGVRKIRLTGGEPLLRKHIERLIEKLAALTTNEGCPLKIALTTNGSLLVRKAQALRDAGLERVTVSLDGIDDLAFRRMNGVEFSVADVLRGVEAAQRAGFTQIKINAVIKRGENDDQIVPLARHFRDTGIIVRFIEFMDVGTTNGWNMQSVVPSAEVIERIDAIYPLEPVGANYSGETAKRWRYRDGAGEIGFISSVTQAFCKDCTRLRVSADGRLYLCLFATSGYDLRALLRSGHSDLEISNVIAQIWRARIDNYSERRTAATRRPAPSGRRIEMSYIGG